MALRPLAAWSLAFSLGLAGGLGLARLESQGTFDQAAPTQPPVGSGNAWGQHTPRHPKAGVLPLPAARRSPLRPNVRTEFNPDIEIPRVAESAYVDPMAVVSGDVELGSLVYVAPFVSVRGDEGQPIHIGNESSLQDGAVIHALATFSRNRPLPQHSYEVDGQLYAVHLGNRVSLAHQAQVHGPARIEDNVFVGMQSLVFKARIQTGVIIEPASTIIGVEVPAGRYVPAGSVISSQAAADALPRITEEYRLRDINRAALHVNTRLAEAYAARESLSAEISER